MEIREVRSALGEGMHEERITRTPPSIPASRISSRSRAEANGIVIDHVSRAAAVVCLSLCVLSRRACFWSFLLASSEPSLCQLWRVNVSWGFLSVVRLAVIGKGSHSEIQSWLFASH